MGWRTVVIENGAHLRCEQHQLLIRQEGGEAQLPIEDIDTLLIDSPQVTITAPVLRALATTGAALVVCDEKHLPCGVYLAQHQHYKGGAVVELQLRAARPLIKRIWQRIVVGKIENQATVTARVAPDGSTRLQALAQKVQSGDPSNVEAQAAKLYWSLFFGDDFRRSADNEVNAALNYGYAVVRSLLARAVTQRGLLPILGLFHRNMQNPFCLVDDLLEPFRPFVDQRVRALFAAQTSFDKSCRDQLVTLIQEQVLMNGEWMTMSVAATECVSSLIRVLRSRKAAELHLPQLTDLPLTEGEPI